MPTRYVTPYAREFADDGLEVGAGYKLNFYAAGTTTRQDTYSDIEYATANENPVVADSDGRFPDIWMVGSYKVILTDADGVQIWSADNVSGVGGPGDAGVFATAQDLRDFGYASWATSAKTLGAMSSGDGGHGPWRWDADSTDDDNVGTVLLPTGHTGAGRWVREFSGIINASWFGFSVGASASSNTTALNAALLAAAADWDIDSTYAGVGGTVFMPSGSYEVNTIALQQGVNLIGAGMNDTVLSGVGSGHTLQAIAALYRQKFSEFCVTHRENVTGSGTGRALFISEYGARFCTFDRLHLEGMTSITDGGLMLYGEHPTLGLQEIISGGGTQGVWYSRFENLLIDSYYEDLASLDMVGLGIMGSNTGNCLANCNQIDRVSVQRIPYPFWLQHGHGNTFINCKSDGEPSNLIRKWTIVGGKVTTTGGNSTQENMLINCSWDVVGYPKAIKLINEHDSSTDIFATLLESRGLNHRPYAADTPGHVEVSDTGGGGNPRYQAWNHDGFFIDGSSHAVTGTNAPRIMTPEKDAWCGLAGDPDQRCGMVMAGGEDYSASNDYLAPSGSLTLRINDHADAELRVIRYDGSAARKVLWIRHGDPDIVNFAAGTRLTGYIADPAGLWLQVPGDNPATLSSGAITIDGKMSAVELSSESGTADTLDTITGGTRGQILIIAPALGHSITISNAGNIVRNGTTVLSSIYSRITLQYDSSNWVEVARGVV